MKRIVVLEVGQRRPVMGALGTDGAVQELPSLKEKLMKEKKELLRTRYDHIFEEIDEFENTLEERFSSKIAEYPFQEIFREQLGIDIPYGCEKEKKFILDYIETITPTSMSNASKQGIELKISTNSSPEKKSIHILLTYSINVAMSLEEVLEKEFLF